MHPKFQAIVLVDAQWGIGHQGNQNIFIPEDLARFKALTQETTVIYGRKTLATFPKGKPLPKRRNLVLSGQPDFKVEGAEVFGDIQALKKALSPQETVFVIGGGSVYQALLPDCHRVYVTKVHKTLPADCFFPNLDQDPLWCEAESSPPGEHEGISYQYVTYTKE